MEDKKILLDNIDKIHTTEMGVDRIVNFGPTATYTRTFSHGITDF